MSRCTITFLTNAGLSLTLGGVRVWVDALPQGSPPPFSSLSPALWERMQQHPDVQAPDLICFTHCHSDHFSRALAAQAKALWPRARLLLPELHFPEQVLFQGAAGCFPFRGLELRFRRLPHEGAEYAGTPHYGLLLSEGSFRLLIAGDCAVASLELGAWIGAGPLQAAVLPFPWLTLPRGQTFLRQSLPSEQFFFCHLPAPEDDRFGYRRAAERAAEQWPSPPEIQLLLEPFQTLRL